MRARPRPSVFDHLPAAAVAAAAAAADVPGLLEGAHEGHGLGHAFLRHISRCRVLLHLLDGTSPDPIGDYKAIQLELELFNPALLDKPQVRPGCAAAAAAVWHDEVF
jgi:GTPase involved in cell partitioning and DNA repair